MDSQPPKLWDFGKKVYSQNGEDGILEYLYTHLECPTRVAVEIGAGDGLECNTGYLVRHHGFTSYFIDGNVEAQQRGKEAYRGFRDAGTGTPVFIHAWLTRDSIGDILDTHRVPIEIDVLSLDIDGVDYWILKAIMDSKRLNPAIIVVEYQDILGPERAWTVPYSDSFNHRDYDCWHGPNFCGASLNAFRRLLNRTYAFVGCEAKGFNGFFLRRNVPLKKELPVLPEMTDVRPCFEIEKVQFGMKHRFPRTAHLGWVDIGGDGADGASEASEARD